mmetsp:Transcript_19322/g.35070  ORF Transcript_19322/g.35070 Transcript_19322/m.35070 type:complete len:94 (+) Transcript_19322:154-435(+)
MYSILALLEERSTCYNSIHYTCARALSLVASVYRDGHARWIHSFHEEIVYNPSIFCSSPVLTAFWVSSLPPKCSPLTKTLGTVLCPDKSCNAF